MGIAITQIDAFTDKPFAGNPAAVCLLQQSRPDDWMQLVAREMNLSETSFLVRDADGFDLRWFTPTTEVDLCGHATLASAHLLWEEEHLLPGQTARFHTRSGSLEATKKGAWIEMDFPSTPANPVAKIEILESALGATPTFTSQSKFDYLVELSSEEQVRALKPDFAALRQLTVRGVIATSRTSHADYDFVSRFFAPSAGIDEDPVTGSAHCCLGPYWKVKLGRDNLTGYQASARGGYVRTRCAGDRVLLSGQAATVLRAQLS
ncbi:MAG TPA: PhzF family phenazine biosynthesis protein [Candidatus Dormibacteraeota bacterium]|nr:PhzF family phenazine biosynthesis protein [Candidatus Dormibacteraeota bacterium]